MYWLILSQLATQLRTSREVQPLVGLLRTPTKNYQVSQLAYFATHVITSCELQQLVGLLRHPTKNEQ